MPYKNLSFTERRIKQIYEGMRQRCRYPQMHGYEHYGGRGIDVCEEWKCGWRVFYEWAINNGYSDNLTLDRIDVNGNYCPENCRWATNKENTNNPITLIKVKKACMEQMTKLYESSLKRGFGRKRTFVYKDNQLIGTFDSQREAAKAVGISEGKVSKYIKLHKPNSKGFVFMTKELD